MPWPLHGGGIIIKEPEIIKQPGYNIRAWL
jgi:hypothetical protein